MHFDKYEVLFYGRSKKMHFQEKKKKDSTVKNEAMQQSRDDLK